MYPYPYQDGYLLFHMLKSTFFTKPPCGVIPSGNRYLPICQLVWDEARTEWWTELAACVKEQYAKVRTLFLQFRIYKLVHALRMKLLFVLTRLATGLLA